MAQETEEKPSRWTRAKEWITGKKGPRTETAWKRMHREAGFIPLQNMGDTEDRRKTLEEVTKQIQTDFTKLFDRKEKGECMICEQKDVVVLSSTKLCKACAMRDYKQKCNMRVFNLFMSIGSPWYRGLDDRELAKKVKAYLELWNYAGDLEEFTDDLYMCSMQLIHLSWKSLDVTQTPLYIIESHTKYVVNPEDTRLTSLKGLELEEQ